MKTSFLPAFPRSRGGWARPGPAATRRVCKSRAFLLFLVLAALDHGLRAQAFSEFPLAQNSYPVGITLGPDGNIWFAEREGRSIGRSSPLGFVTEFPLPANPNAGMPVEITAGPDGALWFTEQDGVIGRISTAGVITEFPVAGVGSYFGGITAGPDGALWFTEANKIGRITTAGTPTEFPIPTPSAFPGSIAAGPDGALWFTEQSAGNIGRITTSGVVTEFPAPSVWTNCITAGPDGALWFTEASDRIGRITTAGVITDFPITTSGSLRLPGGITPGPDGALWFAEIAGNNIGRITTGGSVTEYPIPLSTSLPLGAVRITAGPANALWFTEEYAFKIGRVSLGLGFYTVAPCRIADTRSPDGPYGGPALVAGNVRSFVVDGQCGIPADAIAASFNFTVTGPTAPGDARIFPAGGATPLVSTLNWSPGQTRAGNAVVAAGPSGDIAVFLSQASGTADFIVDVNGYFR